jgi:predicted short-subunit dehydrogenase-like oxidoreductase (DUF2520 family)
MGSCLCKERQHPATFNYFHFMKIVLLGAGNVATVLGKMALDAGHTIVQVYNRTPAKAESISKMLGAEVIDHLSRLSDTADLYLIAVADSAIASLTENLHVSKGILVHTAGSVPMSALLPASKNIGVIYPLQSLRSSRMPAAPFPLLVDANTPDGLLLLSDFASSLSPMVSQANDEKRLRLHLSAVVVNNFSNHLYTLAKDYCTQHELDFRLLLPLIKETADRLEAGDPTDWQTGPAMRNDEATMQQHLQLLESNPTLANIYRLISESIREYHRGN